MQPDGVPPDQFRQALSVWASGVTVVTAAGPEGPVGITVSSFSSLSLDPPLVLVCIARRAQSHDHLVAAPGFAVHLLSEDQADTSTLFARPGAEKFDEVTWAPGAFDAPLLHAGTARLVCARHAALDGGDHTILVGRVVDTQQGDAPPLVYWGRDYRSLNV